MQFGHVDINTQATDFSAWLWSDFESLYKAMFTREGDPSIVDVADALGVKVPKRVRPKSEKTE